MLITVITSYYNDQEFLRTAVESVLKQTYKNFEYILVNHASEDDSRQIAHSFTDPRIKHVDLPFNYGGSGNVCIKKALEVASGKYVKLHCADDVLMPDALETLLRTAQNNNADLVFGDVLFTDKKLHSEGKTWFKNRYSKRASAAQYVRELINGISSLPYPGNFIKRTFLDAALADYVSIQLADMGLWAEMLLNGAHLALTDKPVTFYRMHDGQMCSAYRLETIRMRCVFEHLLFPQHYLKVHPTLEMIKEICPDNCFISHLTQEDKDLFPFVLAHEINSTNSNPVFQLAARLALAHMLNNYTLQTHIEQKLGYTLKDLREDIICRPINIVSFKNQTLKEASLFSLSYFFFRKIIHILTLKTYRDKRKQLKNQKKNEIC